VDCQQTEILPPFRIEPELKARIWGFSDLSPWFDIKVQDELIGEVWLTGDACRAATGPLAGWTLGKIAAEHKALLLGAYAGSDNFPLLIKVLFPREKLSVQVHPDDELAQKYGQPNGKTECWYVLDAKPGAELALGVRRGTTTAELNTAIHEARLEGLLEYVPISTGDMVFVDAGTVHAIGPGTIILETQQNSDITYRMYDYGRPRELHIEKSLEAMKFTTRAGKVPPRTEGDRTVLVDEHYFRVEILHVNGIIRSEDLNGYATIGLSLLFVVKGKARVSGKGFAPFQLERCQLLVIPASATAWMLETHDELKVLRITPKS
jgi:mannose-6-phosphate isomerase